MSAAIHPGAALLGGLATWFTGARVQWRWRPSNPRPRIYFANHSSHLDALVLWAALPEPIRCVTHPVAAQEYWQQSRLRSYLARHVFGSVLIPRSYEGIFGGRRILTALRRELERGCSLILFPEGTRGRGAEIGGFKAGLYQLCRDHAGLEAVPVYLENLNRVLPKGGFVPTPGTSRVVFGQPLRLESGETKPEFLERARQALVDLRAA